MISELSKQASIKMTVKEIGGLPQLLELKPEQGIFVGKSDNCGLQLHDDQLSDIHCRISNENGKVFLQEWMIGGGTTVNGAAVTSLVEIQLGDVIEMGRYTIQLNPATSAASPSTGKPDSVEGHAANMDRALRARSEVVSNGELGEHADIQGAHPSPSVLVDELAECDDLNDNHDACPDIEFDFDFDSESCDIEGEDETYDRATIDLLQAEIEDLQSVLAQQDTDRDGSRALEIYRPDHDEASDATLARMKELIDEANRSDEKVAILEEMLHAADDANRAGQEERFHLEAWVGDIEKRLGQREGEHLAEIETLRARLDQSTEQQDKLQRQLRRVASGGSAPMEYEATLEQLQQNDRQLRDELAASQKQCKAFEQRIEQLSGEQDVALREERAKIAKEQAKLSRMRFEISSKLADVEQLPKSENSLDRETSHRIQTLREHLREIHEQEKAEEKDANLVTRLSKLWKRVDQY